MNIIKENVKIELNIKKSKFITYLYKVNTLEEVSFYLKGLEDKYKDATHICYSYIVENNIKYNDDKEPSGTAGRTMLNVLNYNDLGYILAVTIRYFGGVKLGVGGLSKAYQEGIKEALKISGIIPYIKKEVIDLIFNYNDEQNILNIINEEEIIEKRYEEKIFYKLNISKEKINKLKEKGYLK